MFDNGYTRAENSYASQGLRGRRHVIHVKVERTYPNEWFLGPHVKFSRTDAQGNTVEKLYRGERNAARIEDLFAFWRH